jgi:hypothetical protein
VALDGTRLSSLREETVYVNKMKAYCLARAIKPIFEADTPGDHVSHFLFQRAITMDDSGSV